jgi:hypothetical protein
LFGLISLPKAGQSIDCPAASIFLVKDDDASLCSFLLGHLAKEIAKKHRLFMIAATAENPVYSLLHTPYNMKLKNNLSFMDFDEQATVFTNIFTEVTVLL